MLIISKDAGAPPAQSIGNHFLRYQSTSRVAHIRSVNNQTSRLKEIAMNRTIASVVPALTICIAATLVYNAADAFPGGYSHDKSVTDAPPTRVVHFADLDLSRIEGVTVLYARLRLAAQVVCRPLDSSILLVDREHRACMDKAIADAVAGVNRPLLSRYHQLRTKRDNAGLAQLANAK
jgi:UrcA family protein